MERKKILFNLTFSAVIPFLYFFLSHQDEFLKFLHYDMFKVALFSFGMMILETFILLITLADLQFNRIAYYRLFLSKYAKYWWMNLINPFQLAIMLIVKVYRKIFR